MRTTGFFVLVGFLCAVAVASVTCELKDNVLTIKGSGSTSDMVCDPEHSYDTLVFEDGVTNITREFISAKNTLKTVTVKGYIDEIEEDALNGFNQLTSVTFSGGVGRIGNSVFMGCTKLRFVGPLNGVKSIGKKAFMNCNSLTKIFLPSTLTEIGEQAFSGCELLELVAFRGSKDICLDENGETLSTATEVFNGCDALKHVGVSDYYPSKKFCGKKVSELNANSAGGRALSVVVTVLMVLCAIFVH